MPFQVKAIVVFWLVFSSIVNCAHANSNEDNRPQWQNPTPIFSQKFDWLRLTSGEWLKGDIISMYDDELDFDSDEFGEKSFDWEDVSELRSRFDQQIRMADGRVVEGFLIVKEGKLSLISNGTEQQFPLSELLSITSAADTRVDLWDAKVTLGINVSQGNSNQIDYLLTAQAQRRTPTSRFNADYSYNYSESNGEAENVVTVNSSRFNAYFDWFYSANMFFRVIDYENYKDAQQNIKDRNTLGMSIGYHIVNTKRIEWDLTVGPSYVDTQYNAESGGNSDASGAVSLGTLLDYQINSKIDFTFDYQIQFVSKESGTRTSHLKTGFEFEFIDDFEIDLLFYLDRTAKPIESSINSTPQENDYRLALSVGYKF